MGSGSKVGPQLKVYCWATNKFSRQKEDIGWYYATNIIKQVENITQKMMAGKLCFLDALASLDFTLVSE